MPFTKSLNLLGFLEVAGRKWDRHIMLHKGGLLGRGIVMLDIGGRAPGGFPQQQMQVDMVMLARWCVNVLRWIRDVNLWENVVAEQEIVEAEKILKELESE